MAKDLLKDIKKNALELVRTNNDKQYFRDDIILLSKNNVFDIAKNKLDKITKNIDDNYLEFLEAFTHYISNISKKEKLSYNKESKKEVKVYFKFVKKSIKIIEQKFDDNYLLLSRDFQKQEFFSIDNFKLINILDELTQILNHFEYNKQADLLFMIKGKIELGIERYFYFKKENILLKKFDIYGNFKKCSDFEILELFDKILLDDVFYKKNIKNIAINIKNNNNNLNVLNMIIYLNVLKKIDKNKYEIELKKYLTYFENFPKYILNKEEFDKLIKIKKSINPQINIEFLNKNNKYLIELNSIEIANSILEKL